jgi:hypothetical protein
MGEAGARRTKVSAEGAEDGELRLQRVMIHLAMSENTPSQISSDLDQMSERVVKNWGPSQRGEPHRRRREKGSR